MNELLLWMSVRRQGGMSAFRAKAVELSGGPSSGLARHRIAEWNLSQLGHAEFGAAAGGGWRICPPVLAAGDPLGPWSAVLCGARTPALVQRLASASSTGLSIRSQSNGPDVIEVKAERASDLLAIAQGSGIPLQWNASLAILAASESPATVALEPASVPVGAWTVSRFSKSKLSWVPSAVREVQEAKAGLFRFRSEHGSTHILKEDGAAFRSEPASGKYRTLTRRHRPLRYDGQLREVSTSVSCRPPPLVERALTICTGVLAPLRDGRIIYGGVRRDVAEAAASVLHQRLF